MQELSKYQLKQLSPAELVEYVRSQTGRDANERSVYGGVIYIEKETAYEKGIGYHVTAETHDNYMVWDDFAETEEELAESIERAEEQLADQAEIDADEEDQ